MGAHLIDGEFQSDKYPTTPPGKVPLSVKDPMAQDLLWEYAQRRRGIDVEFSDDLETALKTAGFIPPAIAITAASHPMLHRAFKVVKEDNGGHLIGTFYPGMPLDLNRFLVPFAWEALIAPAEAGLARLRATSEEDWQTFVIGEFSEVEAIRKREGDLEIAHRLLADWFNGWQAEDAPKVV